MKQANPHLTARRAQKAALLPEVVQLAREGLSYQNIADRVGLAKSTVCQWLRGRPLEQAAKTLGTPRMTAKLAKRYEALYQKAIREWARSKTDREIRTVETIAPAGGSPTTKTTIRTEPRTGNAACLGKALGAMQAMERLHYREHQRLETEAEFGSRPSATDRAAGEDDQGALLDEESVTPPEEDTDRTTERILAALDAAKAAADEKARALMAWRRATENAHKSPTDEDTAADPSCQEDAALPASEVDSSTVDPNEELQTLAELRSQALAILDARRLAAAEGSGIGLGGGKAAGKAIQHVGRNAPCPCGSGKKFKKCCLKSSSPSGPMAGSPADAATTAARSVNAGTATSGLGRPKSLVLKKFGLPDDECSTVFRSPTLPNDLAQKVGQGRRENNEPAMTFNRNLQRIMTSEPPEASNLPQSPAEHSKHIFNQA